MNWKEMKKGIFYITYALILCFLLFNIRSVVQIGGRVLGMLFPFVLGAGIAFILSLPMGYFEKKCAFLDKKPSYRKWKRPFGLILTFMVFVGVCSLVVLLIVPAIQETAQKVMDTVPGFLVFLLEKLETWNLPVDELELWLNETAINWSYLGEQALNLLKSWSSGFFASTYGVVTSVVGVIADVVIALIFAIYILFSKEKLYGQFKKLCYAFLPEKAADQVFYVGSMTHKTFAGFFAGQCVEACILGSMFVLAMAALKLPYAILIGVLIGITSLIPVFGAFVGCVIGVVLIVMVNPMRAVIFLVLFLVLQQIEGNLIYPKVVGGSVGLPGIWVLVAVSVGASMAGVIGMILFIPLFSVGYALLREHTNNRLEENKNQ